AKRLNINRTLTDYPQLDPATGRIDTSNAAIVTQLNNAITERQTLCQDIFDLLRFVTTGVRPGTGLPAFGSAEYNGLRWLAQLAVNIVDMRDVDNIMTVFNWDQTNGQYVYGTELPRVLINEVYAEMVNDPTDKGGAMAKQDYT